jgi:ketosteroid isomerase-like protein
MEAYSKVGGETTLTWQPMKSDASASGDLGYTFGRYETAGKDKDGREVKGYGVYVTIWKRQLDGSWRFVLDGGNATPLHSASSGQGTESAKINSVPRS